MTGQSHIVVICSLPIYLRSHDGYYKDQQTHEKKNLELARRNYDAMGSAKIPFNSLNSFELVKQDSWWPPWQYNDIVGYIEIYCD